MHVKDNELVDLAKEVVPDCNVPNRTANNLYILTNIVTEQHGRVYARFSAGPHFCPDSN